MKRVLYSLVALATMALSASCVREFEPNPIKGEMVETSFTVTLDDGVATKAAIGNDAAKIDKLIVAAFKKSDGTYLPDLNETNGNFIVSAVENNNEGKKQFSVQAKLVRNFQYTIAFFALHDGAPYTLGTDGSITMAAGATNDETLDAFYKAEDITLDPSDPESLIKTITLTRPLAQINILSNPADWAAAVTSGITSGLQSSISVAKAPNKLNLFDGAISGETTLAFTQTAIPEGTVNVAAASETAVNAQYVAMAYVLSSATASPVDVTFSVPANGDDFAGFTRKVENVPNKANFRTNLHGDLFTTTGDFTVVVDPTFGGNDNQNINIPQPTVSPLSDIPEAITNANSGIQKPEINPGNNVTTNIDDGKLFFGIDSNSDGAITYSSSDHNVGTIDNDGVFTPVGPGTTNITVTQAAGTQTKAIGDPLAEITIVYHVTVVETTYAISKNTPDNGTLTIKIDENEVTEAAAAATITVATEPAAGYELATLTYTPEGESPVDIKDAGSFTMPAKAVEVNATFSQIPPSQYAITKSTENGTFKVKVGSEEVTTATEGATVVISDYEGATGYEFASVSVKKNSNNDAVPVSENSFTMPGEAVTVTVVFSKINYTITKNTVSNGSITVSAETANYGDEITLTATSADGYSFGAWDVKQGETVITVTDNKFTMPAGNVTVGATFTQNAPTKYNVIIDDAIENGTVIADKAEAAAGETVTLTVTPNTGYQLKAGTLLVLNGSTADEVALSGTSFQMPAANVEVSAEFELIPVKTLTSIAITTDPTTVSFAEGDEFVFDGIVTATFANATPATESVALADLVFKDENDNVLTPGTSTLSTVGNGQIIAIYYTFSGVTKDAMYEISVAADTPAPSPVDRTGFAFSASSVTATIGEAAPTYPTLSGTVSGDTPSYSSSNTSVATVNSSTGAITLVGKGTTTITASVAANGNYNAQEISYTLIVKAWVLVNNASTLAAGDQILLLATKDDASFVNGGVNGKYLDSANGVTVTSNVITTNSSSKVIITLGKSGDNWTLTAGNTLIKYTNADLSSTGNYSTWSISISSGTATISEAGSTDLNNNRFLYNANSPRFKPYSSAANASMILPQIYRLEQ